MLIGNLCYNKITTQTLVCDFKLIYDEVDIKMKAKWRQQWIMLKNHPITIFHFYVKYILFLANSLWSLSATFVIIHSHFWGKVIRSLSLLSIINSTFSASNPSTLIILPWLICLYSQLVNVIYHEFRDPFIYFAQHNCCRAPFLCYDPNLVQMLVLIPLYPTMNIM